jgi:hypothetical protein
MFHHSDFQSKNFSYAIFIVKKWPLYVNFSIPPCGNWWFSQGSTPRVGMRFVDMYLTHLKTRIRRGSFHIYFKKWFFWTPKECWPPQTRAKNSFSSTFNVMISHMVRNESVRFGRHIDVEVSYKILQLEVPKLVQILYYLACFQ